MKRDRVVVTAFSVSLFFVVLSGIVATMGLPLDSGDLIIRFDNYHNRVIWTGSVGTYFGVIGLVLVMVGLNFFLAKQVWERERFISYALAVGTLAVTLLFLIATFAVSLIN